MTVRDFPRPEPWPTELFDQYGLADLQQLRVDLDEAIRERTQSAVAPSSCPDCGDLAHPAASICEGCGSRLFPKNSNGPRRNSLEGMRAPRAEEVSVVNANDDPFVQSVDMALGAVGRRPARLSVVEPTDDNIYNGPGVEGGIAYSVADDEPGSLGENDWRL